MGKKNLKSSSQESSLILECTQPPLKKTKLNSNESDKSDIFLTQELTLSNPEKRTSIIIKKGDKIQKRITQLQKLIDQEEQEVFLMSSGDSIQKLLSIIEILKVKIIETNPRGTFEQLNKLDKYETFTRKNEILEKKIKVPVLYSLIRKISHDNGDEFAEWTKQIVE